MEIRRRGFLAGLGLLVAAPAIIRTPGLLMPIKPQLILPGNFELEGYRLDPTMAYEWATTHVMGEAISRPDRSLRQPWGDDWRPVPASLVGAQTAFAGQQLVMRPKHDYESAGVKAYQDTLARQEAMKRRIFTDLPDLSGSIPGFKWNFG